MAQIDYQTIENSNGEFDVILPLIKVTSSEDLLFQQVELLLDTWKNDFVYDVNKGIPYQDILKKDFDYSDLESLFYEKLSKLKYFKNMIDFNANLDVKRNLNINFTIIGSSDIQRFFNVVFVDNFNNILTDSSGAILTI